MTFRGILDSVVRLWGSEGGKNEGSQEQKPDARHDAGHVCLAFDEEARGKHGDRGWSRLRCDIIATSSL